MRLLSLFLLFFHSHSLNTFALLSSLHDTSDLIQNLVLVFFFPSSELSPGVCSFFRLSNIIICVSCFVSLYLSLSVFPFHFFKFSFLCPAFLSTAYLDIFHLSSSVFFTQKIISSKFSFFLFSFFHSCTIFYFIRCVYYLHRQSCSVLVFLSFHFISFVLLSIFLLLHSVSSLLLDIFLFAGIGTVRFCFYSSFLIYIFSSLFCFLH